MALILVLTVLTVVAIVSTLVQLRRDGYRRVPTDPRRLPARADDGESLVVLRTTTAPMPVEPAPAAPARPELTGAHTARRARPRTRQSAAAIARR